MKTPRSLWVTFLLFLPSIAFAAEAPDEDASFGNDTNRYAIRLAWHRKIILEGYNTAGKHDPSWDAAAREALGEWAGVRAADRVDPARLKRITTAVQRAKEAGCDDPLVTYVGLKYLDSGPSDDPKGHARQYSKVGLALAKTDYSDWIKFYGHLRAAQALSNAFSIDTNYWSPFVNAVVKARPLLVSNLEKGDAPIEDAYMAANELLATAKAATKLYSDTYAVIEPPLFKNYTNHYLPLLLKGEYYLNYAWKARGNSLADKVPESAWPLFSQRLEVASKAVEAAWKLNPQDSRIAVLGMRVETGEGKGREVMETWFKRAMKANPASYTACFSKMNYLEPKWFGSPEEMIAFGRECATSKVYKGRVPLILVNAHSRLSKYVPKDDRDKYWVRPGVWKDVKASYEPYLATHPDADRDRADYLRYAQMCEQWADYLSIVKQFDARTRENVASNMGRDEFDRLLNKAKEKASAGKE